MIRAIVGVLLAVFVVWLMIEGTFFLLLRLLLVIHTTWEYSAVTTAIIYASAFLIVIGLLVALVVLVKRG